MADFEASACFTGARPGFVFKMDAQGLGYYRDAQNAYRPRSILDELHKAGRVPRKEQAPAPKQADPRCYYTVLGVAATATDDELRRAYRSMALQHHPDKNPDQETTETFQKIKAAYALLSDPHERRWYDLHRDEILSGSAPGSGAEAASAAAKEEQIDPSAEEPPFNVWPYFSPKAYSGDANFFTVYGAVFDELAAEAVQQPTDGSAALPRLGGSSSDWADVESFYARWATFETAKKFASADRHDLKRASKERRKKMERENAACRAEARRARTECVRALVEHVRKRDPRVVAHEAERARARASKPSKLHAERMRLLQAELAELEAEEEDDDDDDEEEEKMRSK